MDRVKILAGASGDLGILNFGVDAPSDRWSADWGLWLVLKPDVSIRAKDRYSAKNQELSLICASGSQVRSYQELKRAVNEEWLLETLAGKRHSIV